jgi:hypothetical protein
MTKTEYLAQRAQLERDISELREKIEGIESTPTAVPTQGQYNDGLFVHTPLTFCPPGPEARTKLIWSSLSSIFTEGVTSIIV